MIDAIEIDTLARIIRDTRLEIKRNPRFSRETMLILIIAGILEAMTKSFPDFDAQKFLENCYGG